MAAKIEETAIAAVVVRHFQDIGADVYQEVTLGSASARADIVAVSGSVIHVIECKVAFGLKVVDQAWGWRRFAHRVSVAVLGSSGRNRVLYQFCKEEGIGIYEVDVPIEQYWRELRCREHLAPRFYRRADTKRLAKALCEQQKTYAEAGNAAGKFWSPFKNTCSQLREAVAKQPGLPIRAYIERIKHHYNSDKNAISSLHKWIARGDVDGVKVSDEYPARLYMRS
jgi:hypothetical protein